MPQSCRKAVVDLEYGCAKRTFGFQNTKRNYYARLCALAEGRVGCSAHLGPLEASGSRWWVKDGIKDSEPRQFVADYTTQDEPLERDASYFRPPLWPHHADCDKIRRTSSLIIHSPHSSNYYSFSSPNPNCHSLALVRVFSLCQDLCCS